MSHNKYWDHGQAPLPGPLVGHAAKPESVTASGGTTRHTVKFYSVAITFHGHESRYGVLATNHEDAILAARRECSGRVVGVSKSPVNEITGAALSGILEAFGIEAEG